MKRCVSNKVNADTNLYASDEISYQEWLSILDGLGKVVRAFNDMGKGYDMLIEEILDPGEEDPRSKLQYIIDKLEGYLDIIDNLSDDELDHVINKYYQEVNFEN